MIIDLFSKYAWIVPLKNKKDITITNAFQKILDDLERSEAKSKGRKPYKTWVGKGSEFYNNSFKKWFRDSDIEMHLIHKKENQLLLKNLLEH